MSTVPPRRGPATSLPPPPAARATAAPGSQLPPTIRLERLPAGDERLPAARDSHHLPAARALPTRPGPQGRHPGGGPLDAPPHRAGAGGVTGILDALLSETSRMPSALDVDAARLPTAPTHPPARPRAGTHARTRALLAEEVSDRRTERLRTLALAGSLTALALLSAGVLRLAL